MKYLLFTLLFTSQEAFARFSDIALEKAFDSYEQIAKITVTDSSPHYWESPRGKRICGYTITAEILDNIKGNSIGEIKFGSQNNENVRQTLLAFLKQYEGDFPSDVRVKYDSNFQSSKDYCLEQIPSLKVSPLVTFSYSSSEELIYPSPLITFPEDILVNTIEVKKVVLNNKEVSIEDIPFEILMSLPIGGRTNIRYINSKALEEWFKNKQKK